MLPAAAFTVTKRFGDLPCAHRQWRADNHCAFVHGYCRSFTFHFACSALSAEGFVVDFSELKPLRAWLESLFDHTLLICADDPELAAFQALDQCGVVDLRVLEGVSSEHLAALALEQANRIVRRSTGDRAWCVHVEARENAKNAATASLRDATPKAG